MAITDEISDKSAGALLNEEKGNLFEFIIAQNLARLSNIEDNFLLNLNANLKNNLADYEDSLRRCSPQLVPMLAKLAEQTTQALHKYLDDQKIVINNILLVGKMAANLKKSDWHEADVILKTKQDSLIPISIKLSKDQSFMNTKSAGAKSFLVKYFQTFKETHELQAILNKEIDQAFYQMAHKLYSLDNLEFNGKFDDLWKQKWSELPGEMPPEFRDVIFVNYARVAELLHQQLSYLLKVDKEKFINCLEPICGIGNKEILQVNCFHEKHFFKNLEIKRYEDFFFPLMDAKIESLKPNMSSFNILFGKTILQIRVKPMNKFTTPSYKINCSIKINKEA